MNEYNLDTTIAALSSGNQRVPIGIIRISGTLSLHIMKRIFDPLAKELVSERTAIHGWFKNPKTGEKIDEGILVYYKAPKSYTREHMLELFTHGNPIIMNEILALCIHEGARIAQPGEFTYRAFINGRIDLVQAEALNELINADSIYHAKAALRNLEGKFSEHLNNIKNELLTLIAHGEAEIDFAETDDIESSGNFVQPIHAIKVQLKKFIAMHKEKRYLSGGYTIAIVGKANAGKSSLFNILLNKNRAIITEIAGTTRDYITEKILIENFPVTLIDTAGMRTARNKIEKIGIERTIEIVNKTDGVILLFDGSKRWDNQDEQICAGWKNKALMAVINKHDLPQKLRVEKVSGIVTGLNIPLIQTSLVTNYGTDKVELCLHEKIKTILAMYSEDDILINVRQYSIMRKCLKELEKTERALHKGISLEYIMLGLNEARKQLDQLTGMTCADDILGIIFSKFCIGK